MPRTGRISGGRQSERLFMPTFFQPSQTLTESQRASGLKALKFQTIAASGADGLASGGFLAAFALILGASNLHIGIMTAIPFIMQPVQIVAVIVVERFRRRKAIAVPSHFIAFAAWAPIALIPFMIDVPNAGAVTLLLFFIAIRGVATAFVNTSWTSWLRDIAAGSAMGDFFAQRLRVPRSPPRSRVWRPRSTSTGGKALCRSRK